MQSPSGGDVTLFYPEESLLLQVAAWQRTHGGHALRVVYAVDSLVTVRAIEKASLALIDATEFPGEAMAALERAIARLGPLRVAVYAERLHDGLELFVRVRGVPLLLGPLEPGEWEAFLEPFVQTRGIRSVYRPA